MGFNSENSNRSRGRAFGGNRSSERSGGFNRGGFEGRREGGFSGRREGGFNRGNRRPEMHDVVCDKCGNDCQVPFKPTGDKPVLCSACFRKDGGASFNSGSREQREFREPVGSIRTNSVSSGISQEQFRQLNTKLDKVLGILENIEFEALPDEDEDGDEEEGEEEESENTEKESGEEKI